MGELEVRWGNEPLGTRGERAVCQVAWRADAARTLAAVVDANGARARGVCCAHLRSQRGGEPPQ